MEDVMPISLKTGTKVTQTLETYGDSSKPVTAYANLEENNSIKSSTAGITVDTPSYTLDFSVGLDDLGYSKSTTDGDVTTSFGVGINFAELKIGVEYSTSFQTDHGIQTNYVNVSASGKGIMLLCILISTGNLSSTSSKVPAS